MKSNVVWTDQVEAYVKSKAPEPRTELWRAIKGLAGWNGKSDPPRIRLLEDDLAGYARVRVGRHRVIFREGFEQGVRTINCLFAGPRVTVYEAFAEILLDELAELEDAPDAGAA